MITFILLYLLIGMTMAKWAEEDSQEDLTLNESVGFAFVWPYLLYIAYRSED